MADVFRIGYGSDFHRLLPGRKLVLGGVEIPSDRGAVAHSDGDALLHAIMDALLGAAALGDIGEHFPDTDPKYAGASSAQMARTVAEMVSGKWEIGNVDAVVFLERPKLLAHRERMRAGIAQALGIDVGRVSVKAKTMEATGPVGNRDAVAAEAVAALFPK